MEAEHKLVEKTVAPPAGHGGSSLVDNFGRRVSYLRISVTDRCDLRCVYCMAEDMSFLPKKDVLSFSEVESIAAAFIGRGVKKIRITGGEPLVRRDIMELITALGRHVGNELDELTLTTNGTQLARYAQDLHRAGVKRVNVSLDTLNQVRFRQITRRDRMTDVLTGIEAAKAAGLRIKINMVAMRGVNDDEIEAMMAWAHGHGFALTLIEGMPLGEVGINRSEAYMPLRELHDQLSQRYTFTRTGQRTGGPARYVHVAETGGILGFITPMSHNFCEDCNRVRLTATGQLFLCLGQEDQVNLRDALRTGGMSALNQAIEHAMSIKPKGHDFVLDRKSATPAVLRHMSVTGG
jgi:cyclic pyranopterin phosphate synthase